MRTPAQHEGARRCGLGRHFRPGSSVFPHFFCRNALTPQTRNLADASIPRDQLAAACRKAKAEFHPITQTDVAQAKTVLLEALDRLDQRLTQAGADGEDWRKYLQWDALQESLRGDKQPDLALLDPHSPHYTAGYDGLELVWFLDVQHALHNYIATIGAVDNPQVRAAYEKMLDSLAQEPGCLPGQADDRGRAGDQRVGALAAGRPPGAGAGRGDPAALRPSERDRRGFGGTRGGGHRRAGRRRHADHRLHSRHERLRHRAHRGQDQRRAFAQSRHGRDRHAVLRHDHTATTWATTAR